MSNVLTGQAIKDTYQKLILWETLDGTKLLTVCDALGNLYEIGAATFTDDIGNNIDTSFTVNHGLGTKDVIVQVYRNIAPFDEVEVDVEKPTVDDVDLDFGTFVPGNGELRIIVAGGIGTSQAFNSPLTTKGDLLSFGTALGRLAIGADGQGLIADSTQAFGMRWGSVGAAPISADLLSQGTDVTVTPGVSADRLFIEPTTTINCIIETTGATTETFFEIVNIDPGAGDINIRIDLVGNPIILTLNAAINNIKVAYSGSFYRFYA